MCVEYTYVEILLRPVLVLGHLHVDTIIVRVCLVLVNSVRNDLDIFIGSFASVRYKLRELIEWL